MAFKLVALAFQRLTWYFLGGSHLYRGIPVTKLFPCLVLLFHRRGFQPRTYKRRGKNYFSSPNTFYPNGIDMSFLNWNVLLNSPSGIHSHLLLCLKLPRVCFLFLSSPASPPPGSLLCSLLPCKVSVLCLWAPEHLVLHSFIHSSVHSFKK